jgi:hypothetical protein
MDLVKALTACDILAVNALVADASDSEGYFSPQTSFITNVCLAKLPGQLSFAVNLAAIAAQLGYPVALDVDVQLDGNLNGTDPDGRPIIRWVVNKKLGVQIDDVTIDSVEGEVSTVLSPLTPSQRGTSCGQARTFLLDMSSEGTSADALIIKAHKSIGAIDVHDTITIQNIAMAAAVGLPIDMAVQILPRRLTMCPPSLLVEGRRLELHAWVSGVPSGVAESYAWRVAGASSIGPSSQSKFSIQLPSPPKQVTVSVEVTGVDVTVVDEIKFTPLATTEAQPLEDLLVLVCRLRSEVVRNAFFNPLGDPIRDLSARLITPHDLDALASGATRVADIAHKLSTIAESIPRIGSNRPDE